MAKLEMRRGALLLTGFVTNLHKKVVAYGGTEAMMFDAMEDESPDVDDFAKSIVARRKATKNVLHILSNLPLADRIARGKYGWVNSDITEEHFPTNIPSDYDTEYKLFHFNRSIGSDDAIREMEKEGFRPATLAELLVLGETQPELQKQFPIIALGSVWRVSSGDRGVPALNWDGVGRRLYLLWFEGGWSGDCRFLAVRK